MLRTRKEIEQLEHDMLAPYAQKSRDSAGRKHPEPPHPHRTEYQRDRARIIHSRAFRRLEYKTQVFLNGTGDHLRTRLTHTIEVASISRTIARALALNEDLAEAIALAHDLGHAPFGHSGEEELDALMRAEGGFEHNSQSLRIVELIEKKYPKFVGLNLSFEVLEGLKKHEKFYDPPPKREAGEPYSSPSLEAQIANLADEITYYSHDLDDGLDFDLINPNQLAELEVWQVSLAQVSADFPKLTGSDLTTYVIRCIIDREVQDVISTSAEMIAESNVQSVEDVRRQKKPLIRYSHRLMLANSKLRKFLYQNLYYHPRVAGANERACAMLRNVFGAYLQTPKLLGQLTARRVKKEGLPRAVCDYLSGMTDRYVMEEHDRLFGRNGTPPAGSARPTELSRVNE
ncbi:MAG: dGTPase [Chthoniobacter sp.]|jgi:dGTPase|nr:dGTPase [Chthoniobacter sp.]